MSTQEERPAIELVIGEFTKTLNDGNFNHIRSLYTKDGIFMPNGYKSIQSRKLANRPSTSIISTEFKIDIQIGQVEVDGKYAFVTATAEVREGANEVAKTSRDFFTLRKDADQWKIYRYIFNNFTPSR